ncbi:MAG: hypothetical protein E7324_05245 [Clostridiales bacterium]|nr:hypothetical protein [Clostridiales bacterium]
MRTALIRLVLLMAVISMLPFSASADDVTRISNWKKLENYLKDRAEIRDTDFTFTYDPALNWHNQTEKVTALMQQMGMNGFQWEYTPGRIRVFNIRYSDEFAICWSEGEIRTYLAWCAEYQIKDFAIYPGKELYQQLKARNFEKLQALEGMARIASRSLSYSDDSCSFHYKNVKYQEGGAVCSSLADVMKVLEKGVAEGEKTLTFFCTGELYKKLTADKTHNLQRLAVMAGIQGYSYSLSEGAGRITLQNIRLLAGYKIVRAYRLGNLSTLTQRERDTLTYAMDVLNGRDVPRDLLGAEKWIHDFLCDRITYEVNPSSDEDDCAIGALLDGRANCDGYADAFYLMGSLVGMDIRHQSGEALRVDRDAGHMWNLIKINDEWFMVDVTWNDGDSGDPAHVWYNVGLDYAKYSHTWEDIAGIPAMAERTKNEYRPNPIYRCYSFDDLKKIVKDCRTQGADRVDIFYGYGPDLMDEYKRTYSVMHEAGVANSIQSSWYSLPRFVHFYGLEY